MSKKWISIILGTVLLVTVAGVYMALESLEPDHKSAQEGQEEGAARAAEVKSNKPTVTGKVDGNPFEGDVKTKYIGRIDAAIYPCHEPPEGEGRGEMVLL
ncbi:hypothetical protein [Rossellomorea marisflavi]|uniref:hypothetical protein n=1 Tax=Rossellomorea marisflavi TaxID=189381 RepID=UPI003F9FFEB1